METSPRRREADFAPNLTFGILDRRLRRAPGPAHSGRQGRLEGLGAQVGFRADAICTELSFVSRTELFPPRLIRHPSDGAKFSPEFGSRVSDPIGVYDMLRSACARLHRTTSVCEVVAGPTRRAAQA